MFSVSKRKSIKIKYLLINIIFETMNNKVYTNSKIIGYNQKALFSINEATILFQSEKSLSHNY